MAKPPVRPHETTSLAQSDHIKRPWLTHGLNHQSDHTKRLWFTYGLNHQSNHIKRLWFTWLKPPVRPHEMTMIRTWLKPPVRPHETIMIHTLYTHAITQSAGPTPESPAMHTVNFIYCKWFSPGQTCVVIKTFSDLVQTGTCICCIKIYSSTFCLERQL